MIRTQVQLPDELYKRAKRFASEREMTLAEVTRRGLELFLERYSEPQGDGKPWKLPSFDGGGLLVDLAALHDITFEEESTRSFPHEDK